jgi:hypothetical protein
VPSSELFELQPLSRGRELGFRVVYLGDSGAPEVKIEWEYQAARSSHPLDPPLKDRQFVDFEPGVTFERWFEHSPEDGMFFVLVDAGRGAPEVSFNLAADSDATMPVAYRLER